MGIVAAVALAAAPARADEPHTRRKTGTRIADVGVGALLLGAAFEGTAAGLGDHPDPQRGFAIAGGVSAGIGAIALGIGLYVRATSPAEPPDAISLDPLRSRHRWERRVGVAVASLGALAVAVGVAHAIGSAHDSGLADDQCPGGACNADGARLQARAHTLALAAELLIGPGAVGVVGGIVLYRSAPDTGVQIVPMIAPERVGAAVVVRF